MSLKYAASQQPENRPLLTPTKEPTSLSRAEAGLPTDDEKPAQVTNKLSIWLMIFINFLSNVVFSIVLPSLPQYLINVGAPAYLNGWAVAANSLGTFIASPVVGLWADRRGVREVALVSLIIMAASNIWYGLATDMYQIIAARFVVGLAASNRAAANSFLSYATTVDERATYMTINAAAAVLGFITGPGFSAITSLPALQYKWVLPFMTINFSSETSPGFVSALFALCSLFALIPFKDVQNPHTQAKANPLGLLSYFGKKEGGVSLAGVIVCLYSVFAFTTAFTIFETIGPIYTTDDPFLKFSVLYNSYTFGGVAVCALVAIILLQGFMRLVRDERINLIGFGAMATVGLSVIVDWTQLGPGGFVALPRFIAAVVCLSFGFSVNQALTLVVFSKILEGIEQGVMMGWLSSTASVARMICPIAASYAYEAFGPNYIFLVSGILTLLSTLSVGIFYRSLAPRVPVAILSVNPAD